LNDSSRGLSAHFVWCVQENAVVATTNDLEDRRAENVSAHREMHTDIQDGMAVRLQHVGTPQAFTGI